MGMRGGHMLKYHLLIPAGIMAALVVVGVPFGTAFFVGMMAGCMGMMMMVGGGMRHERQDEDSTVDRVERGER